MKLREARHDAEHEQLARRVAMLEEKLFGVMERNTQLEQENARLQGEVAVLQRQLAAARKNSSTSSKPPSTDIVKPPKPPRKDGKKRKRGGQPGHEQYLRTPFPPEAIDNITPYTLDCCPDCGGTLRLFPRPADVLQQVEINATPTIVTEHRGLAYWCRHCHKLHCAPLPEAVVKAGLFGPRLTALVAFMKGVCHASFSTIRKFLRDVVRVDICRGYLTKTTQCARWPWNRRELDEPDVEEEEPAENQQRANAFPFPGDDETDERRRQADEEQNPLKRDIMQVWAALTEGTQYGKCANGEQEQRADDSSGPPCHGHDLLITERRHGWLSSPFLEVLICLTRSS